MIGSNSLTSYTVEVLVAGHDTFCSCAISDKENHKLPFLANDYEGDWLYFRVAANTERGQSDFVPYGCPQPLKVIVSKSASMETRVSFSASLHLIPGPLRLVPRPPPLLVIYTASGFRLGYGNEASLPLSLLAGNN